MANPVCLSPLKFYDALEKQERYKSYAYGHVSPVIMPFNTLYPFQFIVPSETTSVNACWLKKASDNSTVSMVYTELKEAGLSLSTVSDFKLLTFPGVFPLSNIRYEGEYYLQIALNRTEQRKRVLYDFRKHSVYGEDQNHIKLYIVLQGYNSNQINSLGLRVYIAGIDRTNELTNSVAASKHSADGYPVCLDILVDKEIWYDATVKVESEGSIIDVSKANWSSATEQTKIDSDGLSYITLNIKINPSSASVKFADYYSEVFCFTNSTDDCLEIEYWNPEADFTLKNGLITFANNFHFKVLLKSELGKPEYNFEEEATKRLGYNFIESQVSKKTYKFNTVLPEYLCDALRLIRLCSNKILRSKGEEYEMLSFDMDVDWQDQGDLASVNCEFEVDNIIVNLGGFEYEKLGGDYNNDFNDDFKTT